MAAEQPTRAARLQFIPELLTVHAEELAYLWGRRRRSAASPVLTLRDFAELNERIEAHTRGLLVAGDALAEYAAPGLAGKDRDEVFASAYPLLRTGQPKLARLVVDAFDAAVAGRLAGLRDALSLAAVDLTEPAIRPLLERGDAPHAAAAAAVLASHKRLDPAPERLAALAGNADPEVATLAWQVVRTLASSAITVERTYVDAIRGEHQGVRHAALGAAVWRGEFWAPGVIRRLAESADPLGLGWFAAVAGADAVPVMQHVLAQPIAGVSRAGVVARFGHPALMELVLEELESTDALTAATAGEAFTRITGIDVAGRRTTVPVGKNADAFEREFAGDVWLPDAARARQAWEQRLPAWRAGTRWCRGCDISTRLAKEDRPRIDLEALADFGARAALAGERIMAPPAIV